MLVLADSGSTKTDWRIIKEGEIFLDYQTEGINPYLQAYDQIVRIARSPDAQAHSGAVMEVFFYGAGCSTPEKQEMVKSALIEVFPLAKIEVQSDMLGAAKGLCGYNPGIVCVLGTGSNACYYDGTEITVQSPSLGYLLGDEGSGVYIGKKILQEYLYGKLPQTLSKKFDAKYGLTKEVILDNLYSKYMPNRYMATFAEFVQDNHDHPYAFGLLYEAFYKFIDLHVLPIQGSDAIKVNFVGSIAFGYQDILKKVTAESGLSFGVVKRTPLQGLTAYHNHK